MKTSLASLRYWVSNPVRERIPFYVRPEQHYNHVRELEFYRFRKRRVLTEYQCFLRAKLFFLEGFMPSLSHVIEDFNGSKSFWLQRKLGAPSKARCKICLLKDRYCAKKNKNKNTNLIIFNACNSIIGTMLLLPCNPLLAAALRQFFPHQCFSGEESGETPVNVRMKLFCWGNDHLAQWVKLNSIAKYAASVVMKWHIWTEGFLDWIQRSGWRVTPLESTG